jgi:3-deoxy-D-manno-octulosonic-acid transferase
MSLLRDIVYFLLILALSPILAIYLIYSGNWRTDWPSRFGRCRIVTEPYRPVILIHAVSVGEINAIQLLVDRLREVYGGEAQVVISTTTDKGIERARRLFEPRHQVVRYPLDFSKSVNSFLDVVKPSVVALTELEVWPNFVAECQKRKIRVCVINGRLSQRSFRGYRLIKPLIRSTFATLSRAAVQTPEYEERFHYMGVPSDRITITDTMKWDTAEIADHVPGAGALAQAMGIDTSGARPIVVVGSSGPGEAKLVYDTCPKDVQLIIAPRKEKTWIEVLKLESNVVRRTKCPDGKTRPNEGRVFLLDTMGELQKAYSLADIAIVGRSFIKLYGGNVMEPIALGKPTLIGPHHSDFKDSVDALVAGDGLIVTDRPGDAVARLLADPVRAKELADHGRLVILSRQGATAKTAELIMDLLKDGVRH